MRNFEQALKAAKRKEETGDYHDEIVVGLKSDFDYQEVAECEDKILVHGDFIFYTANSRSCRRSSLHTSECLQ
jgi:hypothetical protein